MIEENELTFNYKETSFVFSKNKPPHNTNLLGMIIIFNNPDGLLNPVECITQKGYYKMSMSEKGHCKIMSMSEDGGYSVEEFDLMCRVGVNARKEKNAFGLFKEIISDNNNLILKECLSYLEKNANKIIFNGGKRDNIIYRLTNIIDDVFSISQIKNSCYTDIELKPLREYHLKSIIDYINSNINFFIKSNRIYAGLDFLRSELQNLSYGFHTEVNEYEVDEYGFPSRKINKVTFYISDVYLHYDCSNQNDTKGHLINKIIESILSLLNYIDCLEAIADVYRLQEETGIGLNIQSLLKLIEALLKNGNIEILESAVNRLKIIEPQHPLIEVANRNIRRARVFEQISQTKNIDLASIQVMEGIDFEKFLEDQFTKKGFKVERTKGSGDFGADLIIETASGARGAIQAKRFKNKTNLKAVQEVVASLLHYAADFGIVIAVSGFFPSAIKLAESNNIELWDEDKLIRFLSDDISFSMLQE